ncbi:ArsA family ATPase [Alteribacillus iranensis]|uniref:Arsenite efflux ATP-binding protein ArsA n=1 Tax=Alteribacillus iranensis TaxID=930128 RepID=A0A1I2DFY0_9BACI|nr:ArsA family ATPase [Alteribacillus iranensis]SFE79348.1 arsenite efflux ATP-binding protein ArsA [Alteribacillus iranensis]
MFEQKIVFFGGKGGVGKSTISSAYSLAAAECGKKVLLVSTDPAHNLGDIFDIALGDRKKKIHHNLWATEIQPEEESSRYIQQVKDNLKGLVKSHLAEEVHRQIDLAAISPGAEEAALFDRLVQIVLEEKEYDMIVFDTAPTGHTVRLLSLPEMMEAWVDGMLQRRQSINENFSQWLNDGEPVDDPIYRVLMNRKERFSQARRLLIDKKKTAYMYVLTPEKLPITETKRALTLLSHAGLQVSNLFINKCLPEEAGDTSFLQKRRRQEKVYMEEINDTFPEQSKHFIPLLEEDISSSEALHTVKDRLVVST